MKQAPTYTLRSAGIGFLVLLPSLLLGAYLVNHDAPVQYGYFVTVTAMLLAVFNFATVAFVSQIGQELGRLTLFSLLGAIAVIFLFVVAESLNRFVDGLGYGFITPFTAASMLLIYAAVFGEKTTMLRVYLSINSMAIALLWAMGASGKVVMPF